ncbi:MAG: thiamine pyrophosphate-binding protein [Candidatus Eremiobacteraeota bacterium]|nr:thiamine pyrophosphate-binding protein [Candidatus Eremiobacteraeota bacterium]
MTDLRNGSPSAVTGARLLVDALVANGVDLAFCVPGESYLAVLDALVDTPSIRLVTCRQEGGASAMAEGAGKLSGRPGVCFVTRGPGATNASIGVHVARQDETPLVLFVGQVPRSQRGREAFQEIDIAQTFAPLAKWAVEIDDPARIVEIVTRAFATALAGRRGPVVVGLPEDVLSATVRAPAVPHVVAPSRFGTDAAGVAACRAMLAEAERPLILVGGGRWSAQAARDLARFAEAAGVPVIADFRCQDYVDQRSSSYVGDTGFRLSEHVRSTLAESDCILALGTRLGEVVTGGYTVLAPPRPAQRLIHVYPDPDELGRVFGADLALVADPPEFIAALSAAAGGSPVGRARERMGHLRDAYRAERQRSKPPAFGVDLAESMRYMRAALPDDAIVANGAGNFSGWLHAFFEFRRYGTQLAARNGSMGYGFPAAIAAKISYPKRTVVAYVGDGDFLMSAQELATAMLADAPLVILVANNGMYGTIRMHQELAYPGRISATTLRNPDFAAFARSFGALGELVETTDAFPAAFDRALASGTTTLLELRVDPELIVPRATIADLRSRGR